MIPLSQPASFFRCCWMATQSHFCGYGSYGLHHQNYDVPLTLVGLLLLFVCWPSGIRPFCLLSQYLLNSRVLRCLNAYTVFKHKSPPTLTAKSLFDWFHASPQLSQLAVACFIELVSGNVCRILQNISILFIIIVSWRKKHGFTWFDMVCHGFTCFHCELL